MRYVVTLAVLLSSCTPAVVPAAAPAASCRETFLAQASAAQKRRDAELPALNVAKATTGRMTNTEAYSRWLEANNEILSARAEMAAVCR